MSKTVHSHQINNSVLTWQGFYGLIRGMQRVHGGPLVLEGYPSTIWAPITVNQDLVTVLCLDEGCLGMDVEVNEFLEAPLVGFTIETWNQPHLGGVLLIQELWALDEAALRDWTGGRGGGKRKWEAVRKVIWEVTRQMSHNTTQIKIWIILYIFQQGQDKQCGRSPLNTFWLSNPGCGTTHYFNKW